MKKKPIVNGIKKPKSWRMFRKNMETILYVLPSGPIGCSKWIQPKPIKKKQAY